MWPGRYLILATTLCWSMLVVSSAWDSQIKECQFDSLTTLESCRTQMHENTQHLCPDNGLPLEGYITMDDLSIAYQKGYDMAYWNKHADPEYSALVTQAIKGQTDLVNVLKKSRGPNLGFVTAIFACLWFLLLLLVGIPFLCYACCCARRRPRKPSNLFIVCGLALITTLAGIITISITSKYTTRFVQSLNDIECLIPRATYSSLYLTLQRDATSGVQYAGVTKLFQDLDSLRQSVSNSVTYVSGLDGKQLTKFSIHGLYAPFLWTDRLLHQSLYTAWVSDEDKTGISLNQTTLGLAALQSAGVVTEQETTSPYASAFVVADNMQEPSWDKQAVQDQLNSLVKYVDENEQVINDVLAKISDGVNAVYRELAVPEPVFAGPLYLLALLPVIGVLSGFILFVLYMIRHDNQSELRNAGRCRMASTLTMSIGYAIFGIILLVAAAVVAIAFRLVHAGCDYVETSILAKGDFIGIIDLTSSQQKVVDTCITTNGDGNILGALTDTSQMSILRDFITKSWSPPLDTDVSLTAEQQALKNSDLVGVILPKLDTSHPELAMTTAKLYWSSPSLLSSATVDCTAAANKHVCAGLANLFASSKITNPTDYPWTGHDYSTVYGISDMSVGLTELVALTNSCSHTVCAASDLSCNSDYVIGPDTVGRFSYKEQTSSWTAVTAAAGKSNTKIQELFACFNGASESLRTQFANGVRWVVLKELTNRALTRDAADGLHNDQTQTADGAPGYFDPCPPGRQCYVNIYFNGTSTATRLALAPALQYRPLAQSSIASSLTTTSLSDLADTLTGVAASSQPVAALDDAVGTLISAFNCAILGDALRVVQEEACYDVFSHLRRLAECWTSSAVFHGVAFFMAAYYWYSQRIRPRSVRAESIFSNNADDLLTPHEP
eukprot:Blabericola_migrator_1__1521@NODE_13_length_24280_cov_225_960393_g10_i0_p4_GENE_NODE_13_length_24280_cov_225_960393_g10_i0NODE_13_length_24280_cov_225_960393_g10_i0_p4_ORF_typecomplete_len896_score114_19Tweety/PF04906_13/2_6e07Tweety/PF04906_13/2_6e02Tweety/PF04906_13/7_1e02DUF2207/PF09972_9/15DUF2207/PF09972_9/0_0021TMEM52/PF14979_6/0_0005Claudin_2/PF13903_6/0_028Claudin_2/PF13903_6/19DUF975/PF06161_11/0_77DUF975/PF06161_11/18DUF975/PF06161_11/4_6e03Claudin_3/PF06653_11/0_091Claudin_3/PF06653_1